jgi:DNA-binding SARP family transcriptional activator
METLMDPARRLDVAHYHFLASWVAARRDDFHSALEHARTAHTIADEAGVAFPRAAARIGLAQVLIALKEYSEAKAHIAEALRIGRGMKSTVLEYMGLLAEARVALEEADQERGRRLLEDAFSLARTKGYLKHTTWWQPSVMALLCTRALEHGIEVDYVRSLIRERGLMPEDPPAATDAWPWPLKIYTLGRFGVVKDGKPLALGAGGKRKPLELLMALIALGGSGVSQTKLTDALWPEVEGHLAQQTFEITLHRLRKLIGQEPALVLKDGKLSLDARHCWVDSWACEHLLDRIERALHESPARPEDVDRLARKLLALYQGPFLATEAEQPWLLTPRERLRSKFLRLFGALGRHWEADGKWDRAANGYLQGLEVDPLAEELYRSLMRCYRQQGRPAEARAVYARCCNTLKTILGVGPSPQTETLRRAIDAD